jgi:molybdate transport system substrate-binding protein
MSIARRVASRRPVSLFLPGAFAGLGEAIRTGFASVAPDQDLEFHPFVPSGMLAREILAGGEADIYVSANIHFMADLWRAGFTPAPHVLAGNRLCIIVRPDQADRVHELTDLTRPSIRVVTPQSETDPCGQYVVSLFERAGIIPAMSDKATRGELIHSIGSGDLPSFLADGRADAGIFYASEALALGESVVTVNLPTTLDFRDQIVFVIAAVRRNDAFHPSADAFVHFMTDGVGQQLLADHGFLLRSAVPQGVQLPWES